MQSKTTLKRHADLVDRMAQALGIDLEDAMMRGKLPIHEVGDAVLRCTACTDPEGCDHFLHENGNGTSDTPSYCRNADLFAELKKKTGK